MSGHSKWANIKNRKGAQDKKRSETFTKVAKIIITAIRQGGGNTNPGANTFLKTALEKAREVNMPKDNVERLLKSYEERKHNTEAMVLEGFAPGGVPIMIQAESDNKNRTLSEIKFLFKTHGGNLGEAGSVGFMFEPVGTIELEKEPTEEQELELMDAGLQEMESEILYCHPNDLNKLYLKLGEMGLPVVAKHLGFICKSKVRVESDSDLLALANLAEELEEKEEVIALYPGFEDATKD